MNFWRAAILTITAAMLSAPPAWACSCNPGSPGPPCQVYPGSDAVFVGQVTAVQPIPEMTSWASPAQRYSFHVQKVYRGEIGPTVDVVGGSGMGDCRYRFRPGVTYLVSAHSVAGVLYAHNCGGTKPLENAQNEIAWLKQWPTLPSGSTIFGNVKHSVRADGYQEAPLAGVSITLLDSGGQEQRTATDVNGVFAFRGLKPGKYVIRPERSSTIFFWAGELVRQNVDTDVHDRGCAEVNFYAKTPTQRSNEAPERQADAVPPGGTGATTDH